MCFFSDIQHRFNGNFDSERALSETPNHFGISDAAISVCKVPIISAAQNSLGGRNKDRLLAGTACYT